MIGWIVSASLAGLVVVSALIDTFHPLDARLIRAQHFALIGMALAFVIGCIEVAF